MADGDPKSSLARDIAAWLETVAADTEETIRQSPGSTVVPALASADTAGRRAIALLERLASAGPDARLEPGETLGEGGMGVVRSAHQVALGRKVAVKTLKPGRRDDAAALELLREAWVTGTLEHPNIVPIYDIGLDEEGCPVIVLKRIEGMSWGALMHDPDAARAHAGATDLLEWNLEILLQVLNALRFAHSRGIIHRDLKPENVMVGEFGEVYLLDWGIAVSLRDDGSGRLPLAAAASEMAGTPCYMAPEMLGGEDGGALSERTDVYLAGSVLCEILTGDPPHLGESALEVITSVARSRPALPTDAPAELADICRRAMAPSAVDRWDSVEALQRALRDYLARRASDRLAARAAEQLTELEATIAAPTGDPAGKREQVYGLFGACRFGFHEALAGHRDNQSAAAGLRRALEVMAEFELDAGEARAALNLLAEHTAPPEALLARARAAATEAERRAAELAELERRLDWTIGTRTRTFLVGLLGALFTVFPLITGLSNGRLALHTYGEQLAWSGGFLVVVLLLGLWARESMSKTIVNQRVFASILFLFVAQATLHAGLWMAGAPLLLSQLGMMIVWVAVSGMFAIAIDRRMSVAAAGYLVAFLVAARFPAERWFAMSAANGLMTVNGVWVWKPEQLHRSAEERAADRR